jgi:hypothetical protein
VSGLQNVGGDLVIEDVPSLPNFSGVGALTSVGGSRRIIGATSVTDFDGLAALASMGGALSIFNDTKLPVCKATAFSTRFGTACTCLSQCPKCSLPCACVGQCACNGNDNSQPFCP